jgi:hypothetical protein
MTDGKITSFYGRAGTVYIRTLLVKNTQVGSDIADHIVIQKTGTASQVVGVLRLAIAADLAININLNGTLLISCTIPLATPVDTPLTFMSFSSTALTANDVLSFDITASDGSLDVAGVASFTLEWS